MPLVVEELALAIATTSAVGEVVEVADPTTAATILLRHTRLAVPSPSRLARQHEIRHHHLRAPAQGSGQAPRQVQQQATAPRLGMLVARTVLLQPHSNSELGRLAGLEVVEIEVRTMAVWLARPIMRRRRHRAAAGMSLQGLAALRDDEQHAELRRTHSEAQVSLNELITTQGKQGTVLGSISWH
jgi:hypothetical protein